MLRSPIPLSSLLVLPGLVVPLLVLTAATGTARAAAVADQPGSSDAGADLGGAGPGDAEMTPIGGEILVIATRLKGQVDAPQPPVITLNEEDIAAYGAASISDLIAELSPQTGSGRGRGGGSPVVLINGQRVASFREMRNIPPEAIRRLEVLPEEVALRYGYAPNQRVINFLLKDNYSAKTVEVEFARPGRGGTSTSNVEASLFRVTGPGRLNLTVSAQDTTPLTEAERGVVQSPRGLPTVSGDPDPAAARSLVADSRQIGINGTWTRGLGEKGLDGSVSLNGAFTRADRISLSGLNLVTLTAPDRATATRTFGDPLARRTRTDTAEGGITLAKGLGDWQLTGTVDAGHAVANSYITRRVDTAGLVAAAEAGTLDIVGPLPPLLPGPVDRARTVNDSVQSLVTAIGRPLSLPAGDVTATLRTGFAWTGIVSSDTRTQLGEVRLRRGDVSGGVNLGIPVASRRNDVLSGIGDLSLNLSAGANHLSDFGWLTDWSAGLTWGVTEKLGFQASYIVNQAAPSLADLGNPQVLTYNVPVYDFTRGESVLVTLTSGGNLGLARQTQRDVKLAVNWELPVLKNSNLIVEYFRNNSNNVTASFPLLTPGIEAAFPGRVSRDAAGRLIAIDQRPVTFANEASSRLRWGLNLAGALGKPRPGARSETGQEPTGRRFGRGRLAAGAGDHGAAALAGGRGFGGRYGGRGRGGNGQGRWNLSVYHTVQFENRVTVAPGGPVLDLLGGDALTGGGEARHGLEFEGGAFYRGFGLRLNGTWTAPTRIRGAVADDDLRFGALTRIKARMFADLGQQKKLTEAVPFFKGSRLSFTVDNLLDTRQRVSDRNGVVPISYQQDLIDPQGRVFGLEFRKQF
ncbi:MAG: TonB-dependent receptor [Pseudomonadota bacterium]